MCLCGAAGGRQEGQSSPGPRQSWSRSLLPSLFGASPFPGEPAPNLGCLASWVRAPRPERAGVRQAVRKVACRAPSGWLSRCLPQTCASAQTRNSAAVMEAVLPSTGTVTATPTAKMAPMRRAVVSGPRPQAAGLGWGRGLPCRGEGPGRGVLLEWRVGS